MEEADDFLAGDVKQESTTYEKKVKMIHLGLINKAFLVWSSMFYIHEPFERPQADSTTSGPKRGQHTAKTAFHSC